MQVNQALNNYQKTAVETADILQLVIMCYDAAIRDLEDARKFHENHDGEVVCQNTASRAPMAALCSPRVWRWLTSMCVW
jgi:flagellin-specific chaperone FliS